MLQFELNKRRYHFIHNNKMLFIVLLGLLIPFGMGCQRKGKIIQETAPPNPLVASKLPNIQGHLLASNRSIFYRSARLSVPEANTILQGFTYKATASYQMINKNRHLNLIEHYTLLQRNDGSFHAKIRNNHKKGYDAIWTGKNLYWRGLYRPYRVTSHNIRIARRWQALGFGRWRSFVAIFGSHIILSEKGACQQIGRDCRRYKINFSEQTIGKIPKQKGTAWSGPLSGHTRGLAQKYKREPLSAKGTLWVDRRSGLVLKIKFQGRYRIKAKSNNTLAKVQLAAAFIQSGNPVVKPPTKITKIIREPEPLDAFRRKRPFFLLQPPKKKKKKKK